MPPFDLAKHRADKPVEQIDGLVCQIGDQVERGSTCFGPGASGGNCPPISRLGQRCTVTFGAGA
jgi:hypothetical protein